MTLALIMLTISFLTFLFEKVFKKRDGQSELTKYQKWIRYFLFAFQVILFIVGGFLIIINDSNSRIEQANLKHEKDSLKEKSRIDSVALQKKWEFDSTRLLDIVNRTQNITSKVGENLLQVESALKTSKFLLQNVNVIDTSLNESLSIEQGKLYPISPMDYDISYVFVIKRKEFERKYPLIEQYCNEHTKNIGGYMLNTPPGLSDTIVVIDTNSIKGFDSISKSFLLDCNLTIFFEKDSNTRKTDLRINQYEQFFLDTRNASIRPDIISDLRIEQNKQVAIIRLTCKFVNAEQYNLEASHMNGIRDVKGWYFSLLLRKKDVDSVSVSQVLFYTGSEKKLVMGYNFTKCNGLSQIDYVNKKILQRDFIKDVADLFVRDLKLGPE